ncbi:MAG: hypothetical protein ACLU4N_11950 [Butyricimonas faecihominis]
MEFFRGGRWTGDGKLMVEGDREFLRLKDKYDSYFLMGKIISNMLMVKGR